MDDDVRPSVLSKCSGCKKIVLEKLKRCGKWKEAYYCDINCQRRHWPIHQNYCKRPVETEEDRTKNRKKINSNYENPIQDSLVQTLYKIGTQTQIMKLVGGSGSRNKKRYVKRDEIKWIIWLLISSAFARKKVLVKRDMLGHFTSFVQKDRKQWKNTLPFIWTKPPSLHEFRRSRQSLAILLSASCLWILLMSILAVDVQEVHWYISPSPEIQLKEEFPSVVLKHCKDQIFQYFQESKKTLGLGFFLTILMTISNMNIRKTKLPI